MARPTFLVAEPQPLEGISARKLVLETARYNVITAYKAKEALEMLDLFPSVNGVIVHSGFGEHAYKEIIDKAAARKPDRLVVLVSPSQTASSAAAHYHLSSHDPKQLLDLLIERFGVPD